MCTLKGARVGPVSGAAVWRGVGGSMCAAVAVCVQSFIGAYRLIEQTQEPRQHHSLWPNGHSRYRLSVYRTHSRHALHVAPWTWAVALTLRHRRAHECTQDTQRLVREKNGGPMAETWTLPVRCWLSLNLWLCNAAWEEVMDHFQLNGYSRGLRRLKWAKMITHKRMRWTPFFLRAITYNRLQRGRALRNETWQETWWSSFVSQLWYMLHHWANLKVCGWEGGLNTC